MLTGNRLVWPAWCTSRMRGHVHLTQVTETGLHKYGYDRSVQGWWLLWSSLGSPWCKRSTICCITWIAYVQVLQSMQWILDQGDRAINQSIFHNHLSLLTIMPVEYWFSMPFTKEYLKYIHTYAWVYVRACLPACTHMHMHFACMHVQTCVHACIIHAFIHTTSCSKIQYIIRPYTCTYNIMLNPDSY